MKIEEDFVRRDVDGLALHSNALMIHARAGRRWVVLLLAFSFPFWGPDVHLASVWVCGLQ